MAEGPDKRALIVSLGDIVESRHKEPESSFSLRLRFDEGSEEQRWTIGERNFQNVGLVLGIWTSPSFIPMSTSLPKRGLVPLPLKEAEYLSLWCFDPSPPMEFLLIHDHMELMLHGSEEMPLPRSRSGDLPLFYALRVLVLEVSNPEFLIGHTFPKLERCRVGSAYLWNELLSGETTMPVCTRVDIDDPCLLATFKIPQIHELALNSDRSDIWEELVAVNENLSRLNLLHLSHWPFDGDLIPILRSLPFLETLIICSPKGVVSLRALLPMDINGTSQLKRTRGKGKMLTLLCPRLQQLQIEVMDPLVQPQRIPFVIDVVSLRAECGSPLRSFTLSEFHSGPGSRFELIGKDGGFTMEKITLPTGAKRFKLDI